MAGQRDKRWKGKIWHGWAWKSGKGGCRPGLFFEFAKAGKPSNKPERDATGRGLGKWVRVQFVEVK